MCSEQDPLSLFEGLQIGILALSLNVKVMTAAGHGLACEDKRLQARYGLKVPMK